MKSLITFLLTLLTVTFSEGVNLPLQTTSRSGTYSEVSSEYQKRTVASAKCSVRSQADPNSPFTEVKVEGSYNTAGEADSALTAKIQTLYSGFMIIRTNNEYTYTGWEANGSSVPKKTGNDSNEDFSEWKQSNETAIEVKTDPGLPCDIPDPAKKDVVSEWAEEENKVKRYKDTTKYFKFSYKISYKLPAPAP
jgi:hypothetical protein